MTTEQNEGSKLLNTHTRSERFSTSIERSHRRVLSLTLLTGRNSNLGFVTVPYPQFFCMTLTLIGLCNSFLTLTGCSQEEIKRPTFNLNFQAVESQRYARVDKVIPFNFPREHGPHNDFRNEWWYLTAILHSDSGRLFGTQFTMFRQSLRTTTEESSPWRSGQVYLAHFAVSDIQNRTHQSFERISRAHPELAGVNADPFRIFLDDWELKSSKKSFTPLNLHINEKDYEISLELNMTKPIVLQGQEGLSRKGPENYSYYYSIPRMKASGFVRTFGEKHSVQGNAWFDREWMSALLSDDHLGWIWFSLRFENGNDLVLFRLRNKTADRQEHGVGLLINVDGSTTPLENEEWSITPLRFWGTWPVEWELNLFDREYIIEPAFDDQLMTTSIQYWEGVMYVKEDEEIIGDGYLELTGF